MSRRTARALPLVTALIAVLVMVGVAGATAGLTAVRVLVVKATWGPEPYTDADIDSVMQGVVHFYATASFGQEAITYVQTPWLNVLSAPLSCLETDAQLPGLATKAGWNPADYDRVVYLFLADRRTCNGPFAQPANAAAFLPDLFPVGAVIHELGHTLGMGHAGLLTCWYQQTRRLCSGDMYGDTADVMGGPGTSNILAYVGDFGGLQKARAGWIAPVYITKPGTYKLAPVEAATTLPQALVIRGSAYEYWIDTREPVGNDAHIGGPMMNGFAVHRIAEDPFAVGSDPLMPDYLVPNAHSSSYYTAPGKAFTLPGVFTLTALSRTHGVMTIRFRWLHAPTGLR
jgi:hypothetical protein